MTLYANEIPGNVVEWLHTIGAVAWVIMALYVGRSMSQLKSAILDKVSENFVSNKEMTRIENHQQERHEENKKALEDLKEGHIRIHERIDELFHNEQHDRRSKPRN